MPVLELQTPFVIIYIAQTSHNDNTVSWDPNILPIEV